MATIKQPRNMIIKFDDWKWRKASILDADLRTVMYRVEYHMRKPQIIMYPISKGKAESRNEATLHYMSSLIDINMDGQAIALKSRGMLKDGYTFDSSARDGAKMTWHSHTWCGYFNLVCENEQSVPVARLSLAYLWSMTTAAATFQVLEKELLEDGQHLDEVLLTGLAMMQHRMTNYGATLGYSGVIGTGIAAASA